MKITVEFNLSEDDFKYECFIKGHMNASIIGEFSGWLREIRKYDDSEIGPTFEEVDKKWHEILGEHELDSYL